VVECWKSAQGGSPEPERERVLMMDDVLAMIDEQMESEDVARALPRHNLFLSFHEQQKAVVRPLMSLQVVPYLAMHNRFHPDIHQKVYAVCANEIDEQCYYCWMALKSDERLRATLSFMLPVYVYTIVDMRTEKQIMVREGYKQKRVLSGVRLLELTAFGAMRHVLERMRKFTRAGGDIASCDWVIEQRVVERRKSMLAVPQPLHPALDFLEELVPSAEAVQQRVIQFAPPVCY
jgi:hypothetical protein